MNLVREKKWGPVRALETGYGPIGKPMMTVHLYCIDDLLVDAGQSHMEVPICQWLQKNPPRKLILTHHHEDHSGNAAAIQRTFGASVHGPEECIRKMSTPYRILPYQHLVWGKSTPAAIQPLCRIVETDRFQLHPLPTPGHSRDHTAYLEKNMGWLFAGDLYLGDRIKYFRVDECFSDQVESLKTVLQHDFDALFCAHNPCPRNGKKRIAAKLAYLEELFENIRRLWEKGYPEKIIIRRVQQKSEWFVRLLTMGNASFGNMVRSALADIQREEAGGSRWKAGGGRW